MKTFFKELRSRIPIPTDRPKHASPIPSVDPDALLIQLKQNCQSADPEKPYETLDLFEHFLRQLDSGCTDNQDYTRVLMQALCLAAGPAAGTLTCGSKMALLKAVNYDRLNREAVLAMAKILHDSGESPVKWNLWTPGEVDILCRHLSREDREVCLSFWGRSYPMGAPELLRSHRLYAKWCKLREEEAIHFTVTI